jgi:hypothetical protein
VSAETSLELIPSDGVDIHMGIAIRLPPVSCCAIELVRSKKDLLTISALGDHELLFHTLEPIFCVHGVFSLACEKVVGRVRRNSAKRDWWGGGGGGACCWLGCILLRVYSIACISWFWVVSSCSRLALLLLLLLLLGWPLHWLFLVFTI